MIGAHLEIETNRRRLPHPTEARSPHTGLSGWGAVAFGGVFVAMGTVITLIGARVIPVDPQSVKAPWWVLTVAGLVFGLGGVFIWSLAVRQWRAERRRREGARRYPDQPAMDDHPWDPTGHVPPRWSRALKAVLTAAGLTLFLSIFNFWAFFTESPLMVKIIVVLFDVVLLLVWWQVGLAVGRAVKFGGTRLDFARFPFRPGEAVLLRWHPPAGLTLARQGAFTLRVVEEWHEQTGHGRNRSTRLVHEECWRGAWKLAEPRPFARGEIIELRYDPPTDAPPTQLNDPRPVFWELEVKLELPGLDFEEHYLVPIYGAPADRAGPSSPA